jgi:2-phosphosulfolactate phosphatase
LRVDVAFTPAAPERWRERICIVIDLLRATTSLVALFEAGCSGVYLTADLDSARRFATARQPRPLLIGETDRAVRPPDFDCSNSPSEIAGQRLPGERAVFVSTNGSRALLAVSAAPLALAGCLRNAAAVVDRAVVEARRQGRDIAIVAAGKDGGDGFSADDLFCAGYLVHLLAARNDQRQVELYQGTELGRRPDPHENWYYLDDSAVISHKLYLCSVDDPDRPSIASLVDSLKVARDYRTLEFLGLEKDVFYACELNASRVVPETSRPGQEADWPMWLL